MLADETELVSLLLMSLSSPSAVALETQPASQWRRHECTESGKTETTNTAYTDTSNRNGQHLIDFIDKK